MTEVDLISKATAFMSEAPAASLSDLFPLSAIYSQPGYRYPYRCPYRFPEPRLVNTSRPELQDASFTSTTDVAPLPTHLNLCHGRPLLDIAPQIPNHTSIDGVNNRRDITVTTAADSDGGDDLIRDERKPPCLANTVASNKTRPELEAPAPAREADRKDHSRAAQSILVGAYIFKKDDVLGERYVALRFIGRGTYGIVIECFDTEQKTVCAVKLVHSHKNYYHQAQSEINILKCLVDTDGGDIYAIKLRHAFVHDGHQCMVFDLMGDNLYQVLKTTKTGAPISAVRAIAQRLLTFLAALSSRSPGILHCDLKPENVVLTLDGKSIVVIDFGTSCRADRTPGFYIQSRHYRAPEVILAACNYGPPIDMWSLGCILAELISGECPFQSESVLHQLHLFYNYLGSPPSGLVQFSNFACPISIKEYYTRATDGEGKVSVVPIELGCLTRHARKPLTRETALGPPDFMDLLGKMLRYDPYDRITPKDALAHPFIRDAS